MNELKSIALFVQIVELGSFNQVAIENGVTPQSVSKSIKQLEKNLGVRLLYRTTRKNTLTEDGMKFYDSIKPLIHNMQEVIGETKISRSGKEGKIRITAARSIGRKILIPLISKFHLLYPHIEIELLLEEKNLDLVEHRIDISFRVGVEPESQVIARKLFPLQEVLCASPQYVNQYGYPKKPEDIDQHQCIGYRNPTTGRIQSWEFSINNSVITKNIQPIFCINDPESEVDAVLHGLGIGLLDSINAHHYIKTGELIPIFPDSILSKRGLYLIFSQKESIPARVRLFIDFAVENLLDNKIYYFSNTELKILKARALA